MSIDSGFSSESFSDGQGSQEYAVTERRGGEQGETRMPDNTEQQQQGTKRKRGRPRTQDKIKTNASGSEDADSRRRRGRPKGSKNKFPKIRPPSPPKRKRGRPRKTDPPVVVPQLDFPDRRRSGRLVARRSMGVTMEHESSSDVGLSSDTAQKSTPQKLDTSSSKKTVTQTKKDSEKFSLSHRTRSSSSLLSELARAPLEPPENIFEDSSSSE